MRNKKPEFGREIKYYQVIQLFPNSRVVLKEDPLFYNLISPTMLFMMMLLEGKMDT